MLATTASNHQPINVGVLQTLCLEGAHKFPVYKPLQWVLSLYNDTNYVLTGTSVTSQTGDGQIDQKYDNAEFIDFFQNAPIALHWLSGTGHIIWANNTELNALGYTASEYIGHHIMEFCPDEEVHLTQVFTELQAGRTIRNQEFKFRTKDGQARYLLVDSNVKFNEDSSFRHTRCFIRDNTEKVVQDAIRVTRENELRAARKARETFLRRFFHELKTPLHVVGNGLQCMTERTATAEDIDLLVHQMDGIGTMTENICFLFKFESEINETATEAVFKPKHHTANVSSLLSKVIAMIDAVEKRSGQSVQFDVCTSTVPTNLIIDACLRHVLFNLIQNAVRFSPNDSNVRVTVSYSSSPGAAAGATAGDLKVHIQNNTIKPMNSDIERSFQKYYNDISLYIPDKKRVDLTSIQGLGLGLFVSNQLVQFMGGKLECSSTPTEASFWFSLAVNENIDTGNSSSVPSSFNANDFSQAKSQLPSQPPEFTDTMTSMLSKMDLVSNSSSNIHVPSLTSLPTTSPMKVNAPEGLRVLVVDDVAMCQKIVVNTLKRHGFTTDVACDGKEACDKLGELTQKFDAVLMDLRMPIMDGIEATRYCRQVLKLSSLPIIALTAEVGEETQREMLDAGANACILKPTRAAGLVETLQKLIADARNSSREDLEAQYS